MKTTVIYHSADFDGIFCREIARKFLLDAEFIGWNFGDPLVKFPDEGLVYILDLSPDCLATGIVDMSRVVWIDHHKSSIEKWVGTGLHDIIAGYRIDGVAACRLAWQWFTHAFHEGGIVPDLVHLLSGIEDYKFRSVNEPLAVRLAGEYDIWDKRDPDATLFQHGLRSQELTTENWKQLLSTIELDDCHGGALVDRLLDQGRALQYARTVENSGIIKKLGFTFQWEGLTWLACNAARYNSLLFTDGLKPEHDACFGFKFTGHCAGGKPCEQWSISLYHAPGKEHHDLSKIAVKYAGGGHAGACGFQTSKLPFL